jgi:hypothetical protein
LRSTQGSSKLAHGIGFAFYTAGIRRFAAEAGGGDCVAMPPLSGHVFPKPRRQVNPFSVLLSFDAILPYLAISCPNSNLKPEDSIAAASSDERDDQLVDPDRADPATFGAECADKLVEEPEATQLCHVRFE